MFGECSSLSSLPDISKWNTNNAIKMDLMFSGISSLSSLPDISKWNTNSVTRIYWIFNEYPNFLFSKAIKTKFYL